MDKILKQLFELQDKKYKEFHSSLCPNVDNIIGVRIPELRKLAKQIAKENPKEFIENPVKKQYYEEIMLEGFVIGYMKATLEEKLHYLDNFIPKIDNWAVCDCTASTLKFIDKYKKEVWEYLQKYINSKKEFEKRFAIIILMDYYLTDEYIDKVLEIYNKIDSDQYYVQMGIAWAISVCFVKYREKTRKILDNNNLSTFTHNKSIQKIIESTRVDKETKEELKKLKK